MEIRLLYGNELQWAVHTANEVFESCVRPYARTPEEVGQYCRYATVENLWQGMSTGQLLLWGAFENGQMCAVSAMQANGRITMLYVKPYCQRRRIGTQLLDYMSNYAAAVLHCERVTLHVVPIMTAAYFYHIGFTLIQEEGLNDVYVPLERRIWAVPQGNAGNEEYRPMSQAAAKPEVTYPVRTVSARRVVPLFAGVLVFCFVVIAGITVRHIVTEEMFGYDSFWEDDSAVTLPETDVPGSL